MANRLGDYVVYGELRNLQPYSTHGIFALRGEEEGDETVLHVQLTGDCDPDLRGKCIRFTPDDDAPEKPVFRHGEHRGLRTHQVGPTGSMTAQGWVRGLPCPVEEFMRRARLGEPPPTTWKRQLHLEWFSQNGRMLIEMAGALVEECVRPSEGEDDEGDWVELPNPAPVPDEEQLRNAPGPEIGIVRLEDDEVVTEYWKPVKPEPDESTPDDLQRELDREARAVDRAISGCDPDDDDPLADMKLLDYCIDHSDGEPIGALLGDVEHLPAPDDLNDEELESRLKAVLARLAMIGIGLDVCKHYTVRDCYRLLRDTILPHSTTYREMIGTRYVQHFMTSEYCEACEAEFDTEWPLEDEEPEAEAD